MSTSVVALARDPAGVRKLAVVKVLRPELAADTEFLRMFLFEGRLRARLHHPNVIETHEVGNECELLFLATEYLEGQSLHRILHRARKTGVPLPTRMHLQVLASALSGLDYVHELTDEAGNKLGVVHRDFTPHNVFVGYDGSVKLVDFGVAKQTGSLMQTRPGVTKGNVAYLSPEQASEHPVDRRSDIYAAGVVLWEAATRRRAFEGESPVGMLYRLAQGGLPSARSVDAQVPEALDALCMRALAREPRARFETADELRRELARFIERTGGFDDPREIGAHIAGEFAEERARLRGAIEAAIAEVGDDESAPGSPAEAAPGDVLIAAKPQARSAAPPRPARRRLWAIAIAAIVLGALGLLGATCHGSR